MSGGEPVGLRLGIGAGPFGSGAVGGMERYVGELLGPILAAEPGARIYSAARGVEARFPGRVRRTGPSVLAEASGRGNLLRLLWNETVLPTLARRDGLGLYYSPVPEAMTRPPCPQVVTVHDLIPLRFPESAPRVAAYYRRLLPRVLRASRAVVTVSHATAADLREFWGLEGIPIHVVHQGYRREVFHPASPGQEPSAAVRELGDYLLVVGETRPYKNVARLLEAFARAALPGVVLALVGPSADPALPALAASLGITDRVRFLGRVSDELLAGLYRGALALVFPSLYEGFGIPPLEAMACGCPVAASRAASLPEVCGEAALYFDPTEVDEMAAALRRMVEDRTLRAELRARGPLQAAGFSYAGAAERIVGILREAAA